MDHRLFKRVSAASANQPVPPSDFLFYPTLNPVSCSLFSLILTLSWVSLSFFSSLSLPLFLSHSSSLYLFRFMPACMMANLEPLWIWASEWERGDDRWNERSNDRYLQQMLTKSPLLSLDSFLLHLSCHEDAFWEHYGLMDCWIVWMALHAGQRRPCFLPGML